MLKSTVKTRHSLCSTVMLENWKEEFNQQGIEVLCLAFLPTFWGGERMKDGKFQAR